MPLLCQLCWTKACVRRFVSDCSIIKLPGVCILRTGAIQSIIPDLLDVLSKSIVYIFYPTLFISVCWIDSGSL